MKVRWDEKRALVEKYLGRYLPSEEELPVRLSKAVRYSVFSGGKRVRAVMALAAAEAVGGSAETAMPVACGLEMIHTYSLIHDDLPVMDDDDLRRGKPTCHKVFGEAMAILAGDALLSLAFQVMGDVKLYPPDTSCERILQALHVVALAAGPMGMVGGQVVDLEMEGKPVNRKTASSLDWIHSHKTASLIEASLKAGALVAGGSSREIDHLSAYGRRVGLAFQVTDDILNYMGDEEKLGKPVGSDVSRQKLTYPALYGLDVSRDKARELVKEAVDILRPFGDGGRFLREIAHFVIERDR
jgi:geranylgeranyl diphosphate synthase type II